MQASFHLSNNNSQQPIIYDNVQPNTALRYIYKEKKNQTTACNYCKQKKIKCSGHTPTCTNCKDRKVLCEYPVQKRRGPRKQAVVPLPGAQTLQIALNLCNQSTRFSSVDKFCNIRWWWKNVLDFDKIKTTSQKVYQGQLCLISAWLFRLNNDPQSAHRFYLEGSMIAQQGLQEGNYQALTVLYILLNDYAPEEEGFEHQVRTMAENIVPNNLLARRTRFYGITNRLLYDNSSFAERGESLAKLESESIDIWDAACYMIVKVCINIHRIFHTLRDNHSGPPITLSTLSFGKEEQALLVEALLCETLFSSQAHLFGIEWTTWTQLNKMFLLWGFGQREKSVEEASRLLQEIGTIGDNILCLVDVKVIILPLMILNEVGITKYNHSLLDSVERILRGTNQTLMLRVLAPLIEDLRAFNYPAFSNETDYYNNNNNNNNNNNRKYDIVAFMLDVPYTSNFCISSLSSISSPLIPSTPSSPYSISSIPSSPSPSYTSSFMSLLSSQDDLSMYFNSIDPTSLVETETNPFENWDK